MNLNYSTSLAISEHRDLECEVNQVLELGHSARTRVAPNMESIHRRMVRREVPQSIPLSGFVQRKGMTNEVR